MVNFTVHPVTDEAELQAWRELQTTLLTPSKRENILTWPNTWPERVSLAGFLFHRLRDSVRIQKEVITNQRSQIEAMRLELKARSLYDQCSEGYTHRTLWDLLSKDTQMMYLDLAKRKEAR